MGHRELCLTKSSCPLHLYPSTFPEVDCIAARESAFLNCIPVTCSLAVFGDTTKDYCLTVPRDPHTPQGQRVAAGVAIRLLQASSKGQLSSVTDTLRSETWKLIAERWIHVLERM